MYIEASIIEMKVFRGRPHIFRFLGPRYLSRRFERKRGRVTRLDSEGRMSGLVLRGVETALLRSTTVAAGKAFSTSIRSVEWILPEALLGEVVRVEGERDWVLCWC